MPYKEPSVEKLYYTIGEVAEVFRVHKNTIINWKKSGKLPYVKVGRRVLFKESDVKKLMDEYTMTDTE